MVSEEGERYEVIFHCRKDQKVSKNQDRKEQFLLTRLLGEGKEYTPENIFNSIECTNLIGIMKREVFSQHNNKSLFLTIMFEG